jgi:adenosylhomocysteine nucleosidase
MVLRYLFNHWLRQKASETVRQKVADTVRDGMSKAAGQDSQSEPPEELPPCDVGLVFALENESGGLEDLLAEKVTLRGHGFVAVRGDLDGRRVVVIRSGAGREAAAEATAALIQGHEPKWVISSGFAGGLTPDLQRYDVVMADSLVDLDGKRLDIDLKVDPAELARTPGVHVGRLLTADRVIRLPSEKRSLGQKHEALAVDLESFAVAEVCREHQVRFLAVKILSDSMLDELPPDVEQLARQKTTAARFGAAVGAVWRRPTSAKDMYRLRENALTATDRLAKFLASMIEQLVPRDVEEK